MTLIAGDTVMVHAGCRWFTIDQARRHWSADNWGEWGDESEEHGEAARATLEFLVSRATAMGWFEETAS